MKNFDEQKIAQCIDAYEQASPAYNRERSAWFVWLDKGGIGTPPEYTGSIEKLRVASANLLAALVEASDDMGIYPTFVRGGFAYRLGEDGGSVRTP